MPKKGYKQTLEHKEKNKKLGILNPMFGVRRFGKTNPFHGRKHTQETKKKISIANTGKGHPHTKETKEKISLSHMNEKAYNWKGDDVGYNSLHQWIRRKLGNAKSCEKCLGLRCSKKFEWANINHQYKRNLKDWKSLCKVCHNEYDKNLAVTNNIIMKHKLQG